MRLASQADQERYARFGLIPMEASTALACLGSLLSEGAPPQVGVAAVDWRRLRPAYEARRRRPLFAEIETAPTQADPAAHTAQTGDAPPWVHQLAGFDVATRRTALLALICQAVAAVARSASVDAIDPQQGLFEMGLDSLMSVELKGLLEKGVGRALPATLTFNYPTPADLAGYLDGLIFPTQTAEPATAPDVGLQSTDAPPESSDLDDLSEDDLEAMLQKRLKNLS
jgi:myxalamid-type polyketide synthase MxaE and MxaD